MKNNFALIVLLFVATINYAQENILFKHIVSPNTVYTSQFHTTIDSQMNLLGTAEAKEKMRLKNVKFPSVTKKEMEYSTVNTTGTLGINGDFFSTIEYGKMISVIVDNDETKSIVEPYSDIQIMGKHYNHNNMVIDTIIGISVTEEMRKILKDDFEGDKWKIEFPNEPMKVGDSFDFNEILKIPIGKGAPNEVNMATEYMLYEIVNGKAIFYVSQLLYTSITQQRPNIKIQGNGNGIVEFDVIEKCLSKLESKMWIDITINIDDKLKMSISTNTITNQSITID